MSGRVTSSLSVCYFTFLKKLSELVKVMQAWLADLKGKKVILVLWPFKQSTIIFFVQDLIVE